MERRYRLIEIVTPLRRDDLFCLLTGNGVLGQVAIQHARQHGVADDQLHAGKPSQYSRHVPRTARSTALATTSGSMGLPMARGARSMWTRAQSNCGVSTAGRSIMVIRMREPSLISSVPNRVGETTNSASAPERRLERNTAISQRRTDLDDAAAAARPHRFQSGHRAGAPSRGRQTSVTRRNSCGVISATTGEHRLHGVIDPDIDLPQPRSSRPSGLQHRLGIGDVRGGDRNHRAVRLQLGASVERRDIARNQAHVIAGSRKTLLSDRPADAGGCAGDHNDTSAFTNAIRYALFSVKRGRRYVTRTDSRTFRGRAVTTRKKMRQKSRNWWRLSPVCNAFQRVTKKPVAPRAYLER